MSEFRKCDLSLVCRESWDKLAATENASLRYCPNCDKGVFKVRTRTELEFASQLGRCAALTDDNEIIRWIGKSTFDSMEEQSTTVSVRTLSPLHESIEKRLRIAFPKVARFANGAPICEWVVIGSFSPQFAGNLEAEIRAQFPELEISSVQDE